MRPEFCHPLLALTVQGRPLERNGFLDDFNPIFGSASFQNSSRRHERQRIQSSHTIFDLKSPFTRDVHGKEGGVSLSITLTSPRNLSPPRRQHLVLESVKFSRDPQIS